MWRETDCGRKEMVRTCCTSIGHEGLDALVVVLDVRVYDAIGEVERVVGRSRPVGNQDAETVG